MKNKITLLLLMLSSYVQSDAQTGIYKTAADFKAHKLSFEVSCDTRKNKIHHSLFNKSIISVNVNGDRGKQTLSKKEIYGFVDCCNNTYRFFNDKDYLIAEAGSIYIYTQKEYVGEYRKKNKPVYTFYFSVDAQSDILQLNIPNLKTAFANNIKFLELLDLYFMATDAASYDDIHKMYKLNYIFQKSSGNQ